MSHQGHLLDAGAGRRSRRTSSPQALPNAERQRPATLTASEPDEAIIVVTGLPRSGTSLMMQMLGAAGVALLTDGKRDADEDNPRGYFELEAVKSLGRDTSWLASARGRAVKIIAPLVSHLPADHRYAVIWLERPLDEVLASQATMLERAGREPGADAAALRRALPRQLEAARFELDRRGLPILDVSHGDAIAQPRQVAEQVCSFLGGGLDIEAAARSVDPQLYRQRAALLRPRPRRGAPVIGEP